MYVLLQDKSYTGTHLIIAMPKSVRPINLRSNFSTPQVHYLVTVSKHLNFYSSHLQVFLAVELPMGIITMLHTLSSTVYDFLDYSIVKSAVLVVNLCICLSYPLNFGIYCGMSKQFRDTFKELFMQRVGGGGGRQGNQVSSKRSLGSVRSSD